MQPLAGLIAACMVVSACADGSSGAPSLGGIEALSGPAASGVVGPNLAAGADGRVYLSWIEGGGRSASLRFASLEESGWSSPRVIATGTDWVVNAADYSGLMVLPDGTIVAHYLQAAGGGGGYDIRLVRSTNGGESWSDPVTPHRDGAVAEHGFVSLFPASSSSVGIIWLDGRSFTAPFGATGETSLRYTTLSADGTLGEDSALDERTCECCQTSVATTAGGPVVAYRDRSENEVRDIYVAQMLDGDWGDGAPVHQDGWQIRGCPVDGPAITSDGGAGIAVAWLTGAQDTARVRVAFSGDGGATFGEPIRVDDGAPLGKVDAEMLSDGSVLVSWIEATEDGGARLLVRQVEPNGERSNFASVADSPDGRISGFPRMASSSNALIFAWTDASAAANLRTARMEVDELR